MVGTADSAIFFFFFFCKRMVVPRRPRSRKDWNIIFTFQWLSEPGTRPDICFRATRWQWHLSSPFKLCVATEPDLEDWMHVWHGTYPSESPPRGNRLHVSPPSNALIAHGFCTALTFHFSQHCAFCTCLSPWWNITAWILCVRTSIATAPRRRPAPSRTRRSSAN